MQEEEETLETSSSTSLISEMGKNAEKGEGTYQDHAARKVSRASLWAGKSECTYSILHSTESRMCVSKESGKLWWRLCRRASSERGKGDGGKSSDWLISSLVLEREYALTYSRQAKLGET